MLCLKKKKKRREEMLKSILDKINQGFIREGGHYWASLSRLNNLLIILNISLFFLTELVTKENYYFTFYSLLFLGLVSLGTLFPLGLLNRLWYYLIFLILEFIGIYFLVTSAWYWVVTSKI
jgi:hypothetical protein